MSGGDPVLPLAPEEYQAPDLDVRDRRYPMPWEWWDAIAIYFVWIVFAISTTAAVTLLLGDADEEITTAVSVLMAVLLLSMTSAVWVTFRAAPKQFPAPVSRVFGPKRATAADFLAGLGWGVASFVVVQVGFGLLLERLISTLGRELPAVQEGVQDAVRSGGGAPLLVALAVVVATPVAEEMLYRGVLYQALARHVAGWPAIGLSALAFAVTHGEMLVIVLTFPFGMILAYLMRQRGSLVTPIVAHATFNLLGFLLIRVSG